MKENKINVCEIFGPTIQGEGSVIGRPTIFLRTFGCDSRCKMCDSMHSVDPKHPNAVWTSMTAQGIRDKIESLNPGGKIPVTISGGNPCIWDLSELITLLQSSGREVWIETQGTMWADWLPKCDIITISPKGPGMNDERHGVLSASKLEEFIGNMASNWQKSGKVNLKVVVFREDDLDYADSLMQSFPDMKMYLSVGNPVLPRSGVEKKEMIPLLLDRLEWLTNKVLSRQMENVVVLPQLHVLLYGNTQGV